MSFAENLQRIRKERHLSQEELAELLDVSRQAVSKWEQGAGYPENHKIRENKNFEIYKKYVDKSNRR